MAKKCNPLTRAGGAKKFTVYVHCSSDYIRDRYNFRCSSDISPTGPIRASSVIQVIMDFAGAGEAPIYRYAEDKDVESLWLKNPPVWLGDVLVDMDVGNGRKIEGIKGLFTTSHNQRRFCQ